MNPDRHPDKVSAFVDGKRVRELRILLRHAAFLITKDMGTAECTRIYVEDDVVRCGDRQDGKLGPGVVQRVELDTGRGLKITTSRGVVWAPHSDLQATWTP